jgi:hypothetical protein
MDSTLWIGIGIGAVLSFLASIAANLLNARIQNWLDTQRTHRSLRQRTKEVAIFKQAQRLSEGKQDKVGYFSVNIVSAISNLVFASCGAVIFALWSELKLKSEVRLVDHPLERFLYDGPTLLAVFVALMAFYAFISIVTRMRHVAWIIDDIEGSKNRLIERFGERALD